MTVLSIHSIIHKQNYKVHHYRYLFYENYNVLEKYDNSSKCLMYLIAPFLFINQKSFTENDSLMRSTKFDPRSFFIYGKMS